MNASATPRRTMTERPPNPTPALRDVTRPHLSPAHAASDALAAIDAVAFQPLVRRKVVPNIHRIAGARMSLAVPQRGGRVRLTIALGDEPRAMLGAIKGDRVAMSYGEDAEGRPALWLRRVPAGDPDAFTTVQQRKTSAAIYIQLSAPRLGVPVAATDQPFAAHPDGGVVIRPTGQMADNLRAVSRTFETGGA